VALDEPTMRRLSHLPGSSQRVPERAADPSGIRSLASTPAPAVPIDPGPRAGEARPPRILVVEDDRALRDILRFALADAGWDVEVAENGQHGLSRLAATHPDALILDVGLPDIDGLALCRRLRRAGNRVPVLMVSARADIDHRIDGLDAGADDYLPKPFDMGELRARLRALLRRVDAGAASAPLRVGELRLDRERHGACVGGTFVALTHTEFQLLELLMINAGTVLGHDVIYDRVWGYDFGPEANSLRVYIGYLRRKLDAAGAQPLIHTVRGVGYVLREP
jgi:two-component system, OmpR family, response regulator MprA